MSEIYLISDTHFAHRKIIEYEDLHRPFSSILEHDECLIQNWNDTVSERDVVYHLGDVCFNLKRFHEIFPLLNGKKKLVMGNHDLFGVDEYRKYFDEIYGVKPLRIREEGFECSAVLSHMPIHPMSASRWGWNIHGHLHKYKVEETPSCTYTCVSVEQTGLKPIALKELVKQHQVDWRPRQCKD